MHDHIFNGILKKFVLNMGGNGPLIEKTQSLNLAQEVTVFSVTWHLK